MGDPTRAQIEQWRTDQLSAAAKNWGEVADHVEFILNAARDAIKSPIGKGQFLDKFKETAEAVIARTPHQIERIRAAKTAAETSEADLKDAKNSAVSAINDAESDDFTVNQDLSLTDRKTNASFVDRAFRKITKFVYEGIIRARARALVGVDNRIASELHKIAEEVSAFHVGGSDGTTVLTGGPLPQGQSRNLGPVAGTNAPPISGVKGTDLGEVLEIPDGKGGKKLIAVFGDSFSEDRLGGNHYKSVAVEIKGFDEQGKPIWGDVLTGYDGQQGRAPLFPTAFQDPRVAAEVGKGPNTLPAGSIVMNNGDVYTMVAATKDLHPDGGTWFTKATGDFSNGWPPIESSYRTAQDSSLSQVSGYQAKDGSTYIAANGFDRGQGVTMYRVPDGVDVTDRKNWQPWTGNGWGQNGQEAVSLSGRQSYGEISLREVQGRPVLSGFNVDTGNVEVRVGGGEPNKIFAGPPTTVINSGQLPQPYGGYILPNSTLDRLLIMGSQWDTTTNDTYHSSIFEVNPNK
ncbi:DUF4185 domain-containing protein [Mycobacteroides immunogenum]|uniref:DUF4185 domain-containing protein n=1 Tax=Mycobacteroides immunogenum TaxID=83262 RepID=A0A7V8RYH1_9MYCO|nr:DUF4185 domain-containing protein [Mycobacteroides immunogenum]AMT69017.1 hypothetical protein ABG82_00090 [Mycobacteroides immunogenum]ANO02033.1 hypothetical protein BAB75_00090 [Mycobacteroides immunogenum]KIU38740.1 hypothetical protein TL11_20985 [Mycobacteroides immunogenum]KPG10821.1 hypothetical protein AN909_10880 [Mycobacteroides immunogenum]KPG12958.1 hypothetical protein AN910_11575 [Mycobacteroides immunogenum]